MFTQKWVAAQLGIPQYRLCRIEKGKAEPTFIEVESLTALYGMKLSTLTPHERLAANIGKSYQSFRGAYRQPRVDEMVNADLL